MSTIKILDVDVDILGSLDVDVEFGKTIVKNIGGELYSGPFEFYPSGEVQVVPIGGKTSTDDVIFKAVEGTLEITENGSYLVADKAEVDVHISVEPDLQTKSVNPSEESQTVTYDEDYDGLSSVSVGAIPSSYIGSAVNRRSSSDLTSSGATVNVPSGYFAESASKAVQSGQAGTPVATKGTVSNHSIDVTPSVSNSEGYISGGTQTGNAVIVSASELVSGTENITANGTYDVTNKASAVVNVPSQVPVTESLSVTKNGTYTPSAGVDGFDEVNVNISLGEWSAPALIYEGDFDTVTSHFAITTFLNGQPFSFDRLVIELSNVLQGQNVNKRIYWRSDLPMAGNQEQMIFDNGSQYWQGNTYSAVSTMTIEDDTYISMSTIKETSKTSTSSFFLRKEHGGYDKITAYAWWSWNCPAGSHIKIVGYNRTS